MKQKTSISIDEKFRILFRLINDIIDRKNLINSTSIDLSQNQFLILKILSATGPYTVSELANILNISKAAASKSIDFIVGKKLISRRPVSTNRRTVQVSILNKGKNIIDKFNLGCSEKINSILSHFSEYEKKIFNDILDKYIYYCIDDEGNLSIFCLQCGGKYEGNCPIGNYRNDCYFQLRVENNNN